MNYFDEVFNRIKEKLGFKSDKEMYEYMGVIQGTFTNWRRRNSIPYDNINSICFKENLDLNYIYSGKKEEIIINYKEENTKILEKLEEKEQEKLYHLLKLNFEI